MRPICHRFQKSGHVHPRVLARNRSKDKAYTYSRFCGLLKTHLHDQLVQMCFHYEPGLYQDFPTLFLGTVLVAGSGRKAVFRTDSGTIWRPWAGGRFPPLGDSYHPTSICTGRRPS